MESGHKQVIRRCAEMKQGLYLAFVYIGLVIGAGFASGREIMEYFNIPSGRDHSGIVLATFLLIVICYMILRDRSTSIMTPYHLLLSVWRRTAFQSFHG